MNHRQNKWARLVATLRVAFYGGDSSSLAHNTLPDHGGLGELAANETNGSIQSPSDDGQKESASWVPTLRVALDSL